MGRAGLMVCGFMLVCGDWPLVAHGLSLACILFERGKGESTKIFLKVNRWCFSRLPNKDGAECGKSRVHLSRCFAREFTQPESRASSSSHHQHF